MKKIAALLIFIVTLFYFVSCGTNHNDDNGGSMDNINPDSNFLEVVVSEDKYLDLARDFSRTILTVTHFSGMTVKLGEESEESFKIILGESEYKSSKGAYRKLSELTEGTSKETTCYAICSSEKSIAIAYNNKFALESALEYFIDSIASSLPNVPNGILAQTDVETEKLLEEKRAEHYDTTLAEVERTLGENVANALRSHLALYGSEIYIWLANLWDPDLGAFYYSASARNTEGYLPDLESTRQALSFLDSSGLMANYGNDYTTAFSKETKDKIAAWVQGLQSQVDGYFYHPQWGRNIKESRRGRDLKWAVNLLSALKAKPLYDTPDGAMSGSLGAPGISPANLTENLGISSVLAVSRLVPVAEVSSLPEHLRDTEKWREYINGLNIPTNSYSAGNTLSSISNQIRNAGEEYVKILIDYLNEIQNPENGLWEESVTYSSVNGLMKISETMSNLGYSVLHPDKAIDSCIQMTLTEELAPESDEHVCSVYNPWVAMNAILDGIENEVERERLRERIIENASELITLTRDKLTVFKKLDGGFSYYSDFSSANSQGAPVAVAQSAESDLNATGICSTGTFNAMCKALGIQEMKIFCHEDGEYFLSLFNSMGTIIKDEIVFDGPKERVATFKDGVYDTLYVRNYFGLEKETVSISEYEAMIEDGFDPITNFDIVKSPTDPTNNVLRIICEKSKEYQLGSTSASVSNKNPSGDCYTISFKLYYTDILENGDVMQIHFKSGRDTVVSMRLCADSSKKNLKFIQYNNDGSGTAEVQGVSLPTDEWVELRLEFYKTSKADTSMMKFYVGTDGNAPECYADVNAYRLLSLDESVDIDVVNLAHQRTNGSTVYIDDIAFTRTAKAFEPVPPKDEVADFENGDSTMDYVTNTMVNGDITVISVSEDPKNDANKVLKVVGRSGGTSGTKTLVDLSNLGDEGNCYTFETKLYFTGLSASLCEDVVQIYLDDSSSGKTVRAMGFAFKGTSDAKRVGMVGRNNVSGGTGNGEIIGIDGKSVMLDADIWYTFRLEYYAEGTSDTAMTRIYLAKDGGELALVAEVNIYRDPNLTRLTDVDMQWQKWNTEYTVYADDISFNVSEKSFFEEEGEYEPTAEVLSAKGGAAGIVSMIHDDGYLDSAITLDEILYDRGLVGDVAFIANRANDPDTVTKWQALLNTNRWKIVSHSMTHTWWGIEPADGVPTNLRDDPEKVISEFITSQELLREKFLGQRVLTFAWPGFSEVYKKYMEPNGTLTYDEVMEYVNSAYVRDLVNEYYVAGRVGDGSVDLDNLEDFDWGYMGGFHISSGNVNQAISLVNQAANDGRMVVLYTHKIIKAEEGESVSGTGTYIASYYIDDVLGALETQVKAGRIWNTHYEDAVLYVREYDSASVSIKQSCEGLFVTLTDDLDNEIYNYPLTVKIRVPYDWAAVKIAQNGSVMYAKTYKEGGKSYILADIVPDIGVASICAASLADVPEEGESKPVPTPDFGNGGEGESPDAPSVTGTETFDSGKITNGFVTTNEASTNTTVTVDKDPVDSTNNVLKVVQKNSSSSDNTNTFVALSNPDASGNCYTFEFKVYFTGMDENTPPQDMLQIYLLDVNNKNAVGYGFKDNKDCSKVYFNLRNSVTGGTGNKSVLDFEGKDVFVSANKWYTIRYEFYATGASDTTVTKVYIGEGDSEPVCVSESYAYRDLSVTDLAKVRLAWQKYATEYTIYIDDLIFTRSNKTFIAEK